MRILGLILPLVVLVLGMVNGGTVWNFIDFPSFIVILFPTIGTLIFARAGIPTMFKAVVSATATVDELNAAARGWAQARTYIIAFGGIGSLIGFVTIARWEKLPEHLHGLAPGIATTTLPVFWALILAYVIFLPLQCRLEDRVREQGGPIARK